MTMTDIIVRQETAADVRAIDVVNLSAFEGEAEAILVTALRQSEHFIPELSLVAEIDSRIVGHILLSRAYLGRPGGEFDVLVLAPMAVVPSQSHRGIGSVLVRAAITKAVSLGHKAIVVVGHPEFYARFGLEKASKWDIRCLLPVPEESVQAIELVKGALSGGGTLRYPAVLTEFFRQTVQ